MQLWRLRTGQGWLRALMFAFGCLLLFVMFSSLLQYENVFSRGYDYNELPETPLFTISFFRQFFDFMETPLAHCRQLVRFGKVLTWQEPLLCLSDPFQVRQASNCIVYSFHHVKSRDNYLDFEKGVASLGCEVHVFDLVGDLVQGVQGDIGDGSVTWHVLPRDSSDSKGFATLPEVVRRLGHEGRTIHHLRLFIDFDVVRSPRLHVFLRRLQFMMNGELELLQAQVQQLQLTVSLRAVSLRTPAIYVYRHAWDVFSELHKRGFTVLDSRSSGRVVWMPGLRHKVATQYNLLFGRDLPMHLRISANPERGNVTSLTHLELEAAQLVVR